jgi:prephenate dehydrogenase
VTRAAVVGLGLIGGSAALALGARGYDHDDGARSRARERGIETVDSLVEAVSGAEIVLLAVPTGKTPDLLRRAHAAAPGALLTDACSLKRPIAAAAQSLPAGARFVGGHPMAGSRTRGLGGARPDLFRGRPWLVVPTERSDFRAIESVQELVRGMGALPVVVEADRHDALMTWISHLPQAVAAALARAVSRGAGAGLERFAGPGLLDTTRLAEMPSDLLLELSLGDPGALASALDRASEELALLAEALRDGDAGAIRTFFEKAAADRKLFAGGSNS